MSGEIIWCQHLNYFHSDDLFKYNVYDSIDHQNSVLKVFLSFYFNLQRIDYP